KGKLTEEQRDRVVKRLGELESKNPPRGNDLRTIRCLGVLEHLRAPESQTLVKKVAGGLASARATREARGTLERWRCAQNQPFVSTMYRRWYSSLDIVKYRTDSMTAMMALIQMPTQVRQMPSRIRPCLLLSCANLWTPSVPRRNARTPCVTREPVVVGAD